MKLKSVTALFLATAVSLSSFAQKRVEVNVPNINGYETLKLDPHMHTVFSDGLVWPTVRVEEAFREGLDAISLTEHIEYHPFAKDVKGDHNRAYEVALDAAKSRDILLIKGSEITRAMAPGHANALFIDDSNALDTKEWRSAYKAAKKQNGFIFWNHPGWDRQQADTTLWFPEHTELYEQKMLHGIEVANGHSYFPEALDWCIEKNMTVLGTSDIHRPINQDYDFAKGDHRTMTFVFAKERSLEGIREALDSGRTLAWWQEYVFGKESVLRPFFEACIEIEVVKRDEKGALIKVTNNSQLPLKLKKTKHDTSLVYFREMTLTPEAYSFISVKFDNGIKGGDLNFDVMNFLMGSDKPLDYTIKL